jgi:uncharacterized protein HemY
MSEFPNLKKITDARGIEVYAQAISQGVSQLQHMNRNAPEYMKLKEYTLQNIQEFKDIINKLEADIG